MGTRLCRCGAALFVGTLAIAAVSADAQTVDRDEDKSIVVEAPRSLPPPPGRSPFTGAPIVVITTIKIGALYGDLDLRQPDDAARLMVRIDRVARDACAYLDRLYPLNPDAGCVGRAIANATPAAKATIAAAGK